MLGHVLGTDERPEGADDLHLLVTHAVRTQVGRRFHGDEGEQLKQVVLHHVPQGARRIVVAASSALHAEIFGAGDLHVVDVAAVPVRFKDGIGKAQHHDVLRGFFAQVMVDSIGVLLFEGGIHHFIEAPGRGQVLAEGLFTDHSRPFSAGALIQAGSAEHLHDRLEGLRCRGQVEKAIGRRSTLFIELVQQQLETHIPGGIFEFTPVVVNALRETGPKLVRMALAAVFAVTSLQFVTKTLVRLVTPGESHHFELWRQVSGSGDVVNRRDQLAVRQIPGGTKDDHGTRFGTMA